MNLNSINNNLADMDEDERAEAIALLEALGIKGAGKPIPSRKAHTTQLQGYYEELHLKCSTCAKHYTRFFVFTPQVKDANHYLQSRAILSEKMGEKEEFPMRQRNMEMLVCPHCAEELMKLPKEELVKRFLALTMGERHA